ncbi:carotenoid phi-ring synthase-like isoform X1 [Lytechinus pictus]|uniref:carotenoid phi-ring synthase-like isoform X1 n=1 Tax=Lytechinus pictus TaxID=7653 RepID=UPI0030B9FC27
MEALLKSIFVLTVAIIFLRYLGCNDPVYIEPVNPTDPISLPSGIHRSVLIVGGGLAGLSAALELAERGYNVTVKEASPMLGGRLKSTEAEILGETFRVDHGFHALFYNYYTFKDVLHRLGINDNFQRWGANHFRFRTYKDEVVESKGPYPFNVVATLLKSPNFKVSDIFGILRISLFFAYYNHDTVYQRYGNITFDEWAEAERAPVWFADTVLRPALSVTFNERTVLNAAEILMYSHFYFTGDEKADQRLIAKVDHRTAVFDPWEHRLKSLGVKIEKNTFVTDLRFNNKDWHVSGISPGAHESYDHVILATDLSAVKAIFTKTILHFPRSKQVNCIQERLQQLPLAPPYKVLRVWFDKQLSSTHPPILQTPEFHPINLVVQYHLIEEKSREWSQRTGGSIIEFHLYDWSYGDVEDRNVWTKIAPTVKNIYPEIFVKNFKILGHFVHSGKEFASFPASLEHIRPTVNFPSECGVTNLNFAGDWLHTHYPSALMERAVSTGRIAANQVLLSDHVRQAPTLVTSNYGPGYI